MTHSAKPAQCTKGQVWHEAQGKAIPDPLPFPDMYGKGVLDYPKMGYLLVFASTAWGNILLVTLPLLILAVLKFQSLLEQRRLV